MILFSSILGKIIMSGRPIVAQIRDRVLQNISAIPPLRQQLSDMRVKPAPHYTHGFLLPARLTTFYQLRGTLLPQPAVQTNAGNHVHLDDILGQQFTLLRLYEEHTQPFEHCRADIWQQLGTRYVCLYRNQQEMQHNGAQPDPIISIVDSTGQLAQHLHHNTNVLMLLRPDHYIMGVFRVAATQAVEQALIQQIAGSAKA
jgi:3-(3-hydroxy-phenyl)propionate hydroxylase